MDPTPSDPAEINYISAMWQSIGQLSQNMLNANNKYREAMQSRKRKSPPSCNTNNTNNSSTEPSRIRKKQKTSPKSPQKKLTKKTKTIKTKSTKNPQKSATKSKSKPKPKSKSPKKKTRRKNNKDMDSEDRIYKMRRPRSSWVFFNVYKTAELLNRHPSSTLGERTQMSSKTWKILTKSERAKWDNKAMEERGEYEKQLDKFKKHNDWKLVPAKWKQIDKKAERERDEKQEKMDIDSDNNKNKPVKKKVKKKATKKVKKNHKKKRKKMVKRKRCRHDSDIDSSDSYSDSSDSSDTSDSYSSSYSSSDSYSDSSESDDSDESVQQKGKKSKKMIKKLVDKYGFDLCEAKNNINNISETKCNDSNTNTNKSFTMRHIKGDLFSSPITDSLCHCISKDIEMSKGIAKIFKQKFGGINELKKQSKSIGECAILYRNNRYVYYMITKQRYWNKPTYNSLKLTLEYMRDHAIKNNVKCISMPRIGCGLDKLIWTKVEQMVKDTFRHTDISITVYSL